MPRIDGYPAADPLTGTEVLPGMQGGATKSISLDQLTDRMQTLLAPIIAQAVAAAVAALPSSAPDTNNALADSAGNLLADDFGVLLLAA